jgi:bla regulator protein blaR1
MWPVLVAVILVAQPEFDAVSIKPASPEAKGGGYNMSPGRINARNQNLRDLVKFAYDLQDYQVIGRAPANQRYEILATYPASTTSAQRRAMMQSLLISRFGLQIHRESRDIDGYELIPGKKGPKLKNVDTSQQNVTLGRNSSGLRTLHATSASTRDLASLLATLTRCPVADHTGLTGVFDFDLEWSPDDTQVPLEKLGKAMSEAPPASVDGPSLFTALQDKLGLTLKSQKTQTEVIVIDRYSTPSEN